MNWLLMVVYWRRSWLGWTLELFGVMQSMVKIDIITNPSQKFHVVVVVVQDFMVASARCKPYDSSKAMEQPEPSVQEISKLIKLLQDRVMEDIEHQGKREGLPSTLYQATSARLEPSVPITNC
jgi:hypothetical protein